MIAIAANSFTNMALYAVPQFNTDGSATFNSRSKTEVTPTEAL